MKIILERNKCIGCGSCAAICSKYFEMAKDGKSDLIKGNKNLKTGDMDLEIKIDDCAKDAVGVCPIQIIRLK